MKDILKRFTVALSAVAMGAMMMAALGAHAAVAHADAVSFDGSVEAQSAYVFGEHSRDLKTATENTEIVVQLEAVSHTYNITYYSEGEIVKEEVLHYGDILTLPELTREGYTLVGWYLDEACTESADGATVVGDTTVYAKWEVATAEPEEARDPNLPMLIIGLSVVAIVFVGVIIFIIRVPKRK